MSFNCPVCNKAGLADYTTTHIVCPQCNSDLKPYLLLHSISKPKSNKNILFILGGTIVVILVLAIMYFNCYSEKKRIADETTTIIKQFKDSISSLHSSNDSLHSTILSLQTPKQEDKISPKDITLKYKVKIGDYPSKIAEIFYNNWKMYKQIETDNNLHQPYTLKVGQILLIKIKQE